MTVLEQRAMDAVCRIPQILENISEKLGTPQKNPEVSVMTVGYKGAKAYIGKPADTDIQGLVSITVDDPEIKAMSGLPGAKNAKLTAQAVAEKIYRIMRKALVARDIESRLCERIEQESHSFSWNDEDIDRMAEHFLRSEDLWELSYWENIDTVIESELL